MKKLKSMLALMFTVLAASGCTGVHDENLISAGEERLLEEMKPCAVQIKTADFHGSGVIFDETDDFITVVTSGHLAGGDDIKVVFLDENQIGIDKENIVFSEYDLAFLKVPKKDLEDSTERNCRSVSYDEKLYSKLKPGDELFMVGSSDYPAGNLCYGTIGNKNIYVNEFDTEMIWIYGEVVPGMSGSGVFDPDGNLIGIICGGNDEKEAVALPLGKILSESGKLESAGKQ